MQPLKQRELIILLDEFVSECFATFGDRLSDVRLFGSYARGDYDEDSDIDIMVILNIGDTEVRRSRHDICRIAAMLELKYGITISPVLYSQSEYDSRKTFGFCRNVEMEGVSQHVRQSYA